MASLAFRPDRTDQASREASARPGDQLSSPGSDTHSPPPFAQRKLVVDEREQVEPGEPFAAAEECQLDDEAGSDDDAAEPFDEAADRLDHAAGCEDVVVDDDAGAVGDEGGVQLERVLPVFERVGGADRLRRELAGPPRRDEAAAGLG